jgi:hypothetical protein
VLTDETMTTGIQITVADQRQLQLIIPTNRKLHRFKSEEIRTSANRNVK